MEYTIAALAKLSGVSARTLRYYDGLGLLRPARKGENGYRIYGQAEVDRLQQILFYRELDLPLDEIGRLLSDSGFDREKALERHLSVLLERRAQTDALIRNVVKTIRTLKGEEHMTNEEKFEGFKARLLAENEEKYGAEVRARYGADEAEASNARLAGMTREQWQRAEALRLEYEALLKSACAQGDPASPAAQRACELHRQWLCLFWREGTYSPEAHRALAEGYVSDPRFAAYYDALAPGCAAFLRDAVNLYCGKKS